jgi:hypothetical protein
METTSSANRVEKPLLVTVGEATQGSRRGRHVNGTRRAAFSGTPARAVNETRKTRKPHRRTCKGCGEKFDPKRHGQLCCTDACRNRAWRKEQKKRRAKGELSTIDSSPQEIAHCAYCGNAFWREEGSKQRYCKPSHRTRASQARREASIVALEQMLDLPHDTAKQIGRKLKLEELAKKLIRWGFVYDEAARAWLMPVERQAFIQ